MIQKKDHKNSKNNVHSRDTYYFLSEYKPIIYFNFIAKILTSNCVLRILNPGNFFKLSLFQ